MSSSFASALAVAFSGDTGPFSGHMLQRVRLDTGLHQLAGRDAATSWILALAATFDGPGVAGQIALEGAGMRFTALRLQGTASQLPLAGAGRLAQPVPQAELALHIWAGLEGELAVEMTAIADWTPILAATDVDRATVAAAEGAATPCHRPLGELQSGRSQLGEPAPAADATAAVRWTSAFNRRDLAGPEARRVEWLALISAIPDARLVLEHALESGGSTAFLCRLQGHAGGRRVSLPLSVVLDGDGGQTMLLDRVALEAVPHRPFWPE